MSGWAAKRAKAAEFAMQKELDTGGDKIDADGLASAATRDAAMGKGDEELFEKKMTKEEKKAAKKKVRTKSRTPAGATARYSNAALRARLQASRLVAQRRSLSMPRRSAPRFRRSLLTIPSTPPYRSFS